MERENIKLGMILAGKGSNYQKFIEGKRYKVVGLYLKDEGISSICKVKEIGTPESKRGKYILPEEVDQVEAHEIKTLYALKALPTGLIYFQQGSEPRNVAGVWHVRMPEFDIEFE